MTYFRRFLPALVLALVASCNDAPVSPDEHIPLGKAAVVVTTDTIVASRDVTPAVVYIRVRFPVSITNTGVDTMTLSDCSNWLEAKRGDSWKFSGGRGCFLSAPHGERIGPGESKDFLVTLTTSTEQFTGTFPGVYRYNVGVITPGLSGTTPVARSNTFIALMRD